MSQPHLRPTYTRARTEDEPSVEQDIVELSQLRHDDDYGGEKFYKYQWQQPSIHSDAASFQTYDQTKANDQWGSKNTHDQHSDVEHLLDSSPQVTDINDSPSSPPSHRVFLPGWRRTTLIAACTAVISLIVNVVAVIWLNQHPSQAGLVEISRGDCKEIQHTDIWIHLAINILGTLLLSGSNYCMQCLSAPTRKEVDAVHAKGMYLDIGVPGLGNLGSIAGYKSFLWFLLAISSIPLHLLYNSAIYSSLSTYDYQILVTGKGFATNTTSQRQVLLDTDLSKYQQLTPLECITQYGQVFLTDRSDLIIVSSNYSGSRVVRNTTYAFRDTYMPSTNGSYYRPFDWICKSDPRIGSKIDVPWSPRLRNTMPCDTYLSKIQGIADVWQPFGYAVDHCLSRRMAGNCSLNGNIPIVIVVVVCNAIKAAIMFYLAFADIGDPLLTIGDAIASFLRKPDPTTRGMCLLTRSHVKASNSVVNDVGYIWQRRRGFFTLPSTTARSPNYKYFRAASRSRWFWTSTIFMVCFPVVAILLGVAVNSISGQVVTLWSLGFGTLNAHAIIDGWNLQYIKKIQKRVLAAILIANLPQMILSFLYFSLNGLLTTMWVVSEWNDFDRDRKHLRVSNPTGSQRSTYFLQLPYKVGVPLLICSALLHWFVSQSVFLGVVSEWASSGKLVNATAIASCGFSPMAMIFVLVVATVIALTTIYLASRPMRTTMRLVGSCSAAISAACHAPDGDVDAAEKPVMWGVTHQVHGMQDVGHCSFSSQPVGSLEEGKEYM